MKILIKKDPRYPLDLKAIRKKSKEILKKHELDDNTELSILFVGKRKAKKFNQLFRQMDYIPEVLAFPMHEFGPDKVLRLGDVLICFPLARDYARKRNKMVQNVIDEYLEHGIKNLVVGEEE